jgi:deoxyribonucleoside regulator
MGELSVFPGLLTELFENLKALKSHTNYDNVNFVKAKTNKCQVNELDTVNKRIQRLAEVAQMYYEQDLTQSEISEKLGVSRPLVSKMLREAKELGIVTIQVRSSLEGSSTVLNQIRNLYNLRGGAIISDTNSENTTNQLIATNILDFIMNFSPAIVNIGIGWGYIIGTFTKTVEAAQIQPKFKATVFPLIGNSSVPNRDYHSNEIIRVFAEKTGAAPIYIHAPAFVESEQESQLFQESESFKKVENAWNEMDTAIVNLGNYPSVPDYATATRFGDLLNTKKAVGRMLCSYFDINGSFIQSDTDFAIQIPIAKLARCRNVIAVCSATLQPKALVGALRTGLVTHIIVAESIARKALEFK